MGHGTISTNQKVLSYLIDRLSSRIGGRKKIMTLMFLIEHYDPDLRKLTEKQFLGNEFITSRYGVFSFDVMDDYLDLSRKNIVQDYPITLLQNVSFDLSDEITSRINWIIDQFGDRNGSYLESYTLDLLCLDKRTKMQYFGQSVKLQIRANTWEEAASTTC
jgi:hypothetical protein